MVKIFSQFNFGIFYKLLVFIFLAISLTSYGQSKAHDKINLDVYISQQSNWTRDLVERRLDLMSEVFLQCGLEVDWNIKVSPLLDPLVEKSMDSLATNGLKKIGDKFPSSNSIRLFFVEKFILEGQQVKKQSGFARGIFDDVSESTDYPNSVLNTVWAPFKIVDLPNTNHCGGANYSVVAHELTHVLARLGSHNPDKPYNMLSLCMIGGRNNYLTPGQCKKIINHPMVFESN